MRVLPTHIVTSETWCGEKVFLSGSIKSHPGGKIPGSGRMSQNNTVKYCCVLHQAKDASTVFKVKSLDVDRATSMVMEALARRRTMNQLKCH